METPTGYGTQRVSLDIDRTMRSKASMQNVIASHNNINSNTLLK